MHFSMDFAEGFPLAATDTRKVVVIGAGPVGALAGLYFSHAGWDVEVYELRGDLRRPENRSLNFSKSINLALSERGINGLRHVGDGEKLLQKVLAETIPMYGRMIHSGRTGEEGESQKYDVHGRFIRSADRGRLNIQLLDELSQRTNVKLFFNHGLKRLHLDSKTVEFDKTSGGVAESLIVHADLVIGADGAHSATRRLLQRDVRMYYEQVYIDDLWCEFEIPPDEKTGKFKIDPGHLHIWPKKTFMFIAIPSADHTFTCTLFMPGSMFSAIGESRQNLMLFFGKHFPDVIQLVGEERLWEQYKRGQKLPLISVKCTPYHYRNRCVLLGDAAHAMVPFYGQGMNAGFEDVRTLFESLSLHPTSLSSALSHYTKTRQPDAHCINDLAMRNYEEMRSSVTSYTYRARKFFEEAMYDYLPWFGVRTLYSMVSFENTRYSEVVRRIERQRWWENFAVAVLAVVLFSVLVGELGIVDFGAWCVGAADVGV